MRNIRLLCLWSLFFACGQLLGLEINIYSRNNGVGLTNDFKILHKELTKLGHHVNRIDPFGKQSPQADINIFIEHTNSAFLKNAPKNYFIPNPEWCFAGRAELQGFDLILCRTKEVERIFHPINPNTYYLGFTSKDRYKPDIKKTFSQFLHLKGKSTTKGTAPILKIWGEKPILPKLTLIAAGSQDPSIENIDFKKKYLSEQILEHYINHCGIHLCPSETEGFGHYLTEAMSAGAVVVTTDAPPMNEFITDPRCLVKYNRTRKLRYATQYFVDPAELKRVVLNLKKLPQKELKKIGEKNRKQYLKKKAEFQGRLKKLFKS